MSKPADNYHVAGTIGPDAGPEAMLDLQRLAELGRLSATLLHEISNPLTAALLHLDQSSQHKPNIREARRSMQLLKMYVEAARQQVRRESNLSDFKVSSCLRQVKRILVPLAKKYSVDLIIEQTQDCQLYGDPVKFQQIVANLLTNSIEAYGSDLYPRLEKPVRLRIIPRPQTLIIEVRDWGHGISEDQLPDLFQPFYSTKSHQGYGLGIGLAIVKQYVTEDFGGSISVRSSKRYGTRFKISLPAFYRPA